MAGSVTLTVETRRFEEQLFRMQRTSKFGAQKVAERSFKGFVARLVAITPPGRVADISGTQNTDEPGQIIKPTKPKTRGTRNVKKDILNVFRAVGSERQIRRLKPIATDSDLERLHKGARNKKGRTRSRNRKDKVPVTRAVLRSYIKKKQEHVGRLAAGWNSASNRLRVRVPAWVKRHSSPGSVVLEVGGRGGVKFRATNSIDHASEQPNFQRGVYIAMAMQANAMKRQIDSYLAKEMVKEMKGEMS